MEHVLNSIADTCQTVTTQNHTDNALMKRVPGDIIDARQIEIAPGPVVAIIIGIIATVTLIAYFIDGDDEKRESFTQNSVSQASAKYPNYNWIICHSPYSVAFNGVEGTDYGYTHHELKVSLGRTIGYDLYWASSGTFNRFGDGGYINWAYDGNVVLSSGGSVTFGTL
jgi:hypothetical protein